MSEREAVLLLSQMYFPFLEQREKDAITKAIETLQSIEVWNTRASEAEIRAKVISEMHDKLIIHFAECQTETEDADIKQIFTNVCEDIDEIAEEMKDTTNRII